MSWRASFQVWVGFILTVSCTAGPRSNSTKHSCPATPDGFGLVVGRRIPNGTLSISLRREWAIHGGEYGDLRSATGPMLPGDVELQRELFCLVYGHKLRPTSNECFGSSLEIWNSSVARRSFLSCNDVVTHAVGERMEAQFGDRLPAPTVSPIREYRAEPLHSCRSISDFNATLFRPSGRPQTFVDSNRQVILYARDGSTRTGVLPSETFHSLVCEISRYDFTVLRSNAEGRREYCPEHAQPSRVPGLGMLYGGIAANVRMNGQTFRLRVGHCDWPLDLYDFLETLRTKAFLYVD